MPRWILLALLGAFIQHAHSFSPLPAEDDEWAAFNELLRNPAYRLPRTTAPELYEVTLTPYFEVVDGSRAPFTFDGTVHIYIRAQVEDVNEIVMHCNDLTISEYSVVEGDSNLSIAEPDQELACGQYSFLTIRTSTVLELDKVYVVRLSFVGNLQTNMRGFYRSWYYDDSGRRWMATTQFQPGHARQAFPCYDEPSFKATFDITIIREADFSPTLSNMPIRTTVDDTDNGRVAETFERTPITSTYLLAFIVSHYKAISETTDESRPFKIYARENAGTTGEWALEIGELLLEKMEEYTNITYYTMADHMDMKQAAIPDFSAGAMENWGLLTYREALILYDPVNSNHFYKQRVANIVSHEVTHMWFGNLVTCAWWDVLWLNEGFARFYTYYLTQMVRPDLDFDTRFIVEQVHPAIFADSVDSAHPLTDPRVIDPTSVSAHFSTITYARGAAVIRMTQHLIGNDTFISGLRAYLVNRQYDVATPQDLFDALDEAAIEDEALSAYPGVTVDTYLSSWSVKAGHPLLTVIIDQLTGSMMVTQARWERNTGQSNLPSLWYVPVTWTRAGVSNFEDTKPSVILTEQVTVLNRGTTEVEWVIFNVQQTGFYRINYDDTNWGLITLALRGDNRTDIHEFNRAQIVDDLFALARAEVMDYTRALNILSFLQYEDGYAPWIAAISGFNFLRRRLAHDSTQLLRLQKTIITMSSAVTERLGYADREDDTFMDGLLRMYVLDFLCNIGHEPCVKAGVMHFQNLRNRPNIIIPPNMRSWVYCTGLREGDATDFYFLFDRYIEEDLASEKIVLLGALGCTKDPLGIRRYLNEIIADNDSIRPQDYNTAFNAATSGNEENTRVVFNWFKLNIAEAVAALDSVSTPLSYIAGRLLHEDDIIEFEEFLEDNRAIIGGAYNTNMNNAQAARSNLAWTDRRLAEVAEYLENGYQDVVIDIQLPTTVPPTNPPLLTTTPASAGIARIGVFTIILTTFVNYVL